MIRQANTWTGRGTALPRAKRIFESTGAAATPASAHSTSTRHAIRRTTPRAPRHEAEHEATVSISGIILAHSPYPGPPPGRGEGAGPTLTPRWGGRPP